MGGKKETLTTLVTYDQRHGNPRIVGLHEPLTVLHFTKEIHHNPSDGRWAMPRGHAPKRETKKAKKKVDKQQVELAPPMFAPSEVEVIKKRKKPKEEEL